MSNKKTKPAAGKSVAGKTNSGKNNPKQAEKIKEKQKAEAQKQAQRVREEREKAERERARKSEEIQKRRAKQNEKDKKNEKKQQGKEKRTAERERKLDAVKKILGKIRYYTGKEFLSSFNYTRIFIFIVLPIVIIGVGIFAFTQTVLVNVPAEIRDFDYNGRLESSLTAKASRFNSQQQAMFIDSVNGIGSGDFEFYINTEIKLDDNGETDSLRFGNPQENDCVLVATVYDEDGKVLYRSLGLESGREINEAKFFEKLEYGTHDVKVAVNAYDSVTNEKIGTKYARIKLAVGV